MTTRKDQLLPTLAAPYGSDVHIVPEIQLTSNQLCLKYAVADEHPQYTREKWRGGEDSQGTFKAVDYWHWVRDSIADNFTQTATLAQIRNTPFPPDEGLSEDELAIKYRINQQHPVHTERNWMGAGSPGGVKGYWAWVVLQLKDKRTEHEKSLDAKAHAMDNPPILNGTRVDVAGGKYSVIMASDGHLQALRHGEVWKSRDITGDKFVHMLALELHEARQQIEANEKQFAESNKTIENLLEALATLQKETPWPVEEMTPALKEVLSLPNYRCGPIAHVFVKAGFTIPSDSAEEQAFVIHRYVGYALKHKENWKAVAEAELQRLGAPTHNKVHVPEKDITPVNDGKLILPGH